MRVVKKADFDAVVGGDAYYEGRWHYFETAIKMALEESPESVLEVGAHTFPLFNDQTMDIRSDANPSYIHDASDSPWPLRTDSVDVVVGLQVWEHLREKRQAFREAMRVARKSVILSFPYEWDCPHDRTHHDIDYRVICLWIGAPPSEYTVVGRHRHRRRLVGKWYAY